MKLIVVSHSDIQPCELQQARLLLSQDLYFHVRKPGLRDDQLRAYLAEIPAQHCSKVVLHSKPMIAAEFNLGGCHGTISNRFPGRRSVSTHSFEEICSLDPSIDYAFLSPIFGSISKPGYGPRFSYADLREALKLSPVPIAALGGVTADNIGLCAELGFWGAAVHGSLWQSRDFEETLDELIGACARATTDVRLSAGMRA